MNERNLLLRCFQPLAITLIAVMAMTNSSCASLGFGSKTAKNDLRASGHEMVIVQKAGTAAPVVSSQSRQYWVDLRRNAKEDEARLYATLATGEWQAAEQEARSFLRQQPRNRAGLVVLATSLAMGKKFQLASYYAQQLSKYHPDHPDALNIQALAIIMQPNNSVLDFDSAQEMLQRAFNSDGRQIASGLNLASLQLELGDARGASQTFSQVKSRCNDCREALMGSGTAHSRAGEYTQAKRDFEKVLAKDPNDPWALYRLAIVENNGFRNRDQARRLLNQVLVVKGANQLLRERANVVLRRIDGRDERQYIVRQQPDETSDLDLMLTSMDDD